MKFSTSHSEILISILYCPLQKVEHELHNRSVTSKFTGNLLHSSRQSSASYSSTSLNSNDMNDLGYLLTVIKDEGHGIEESNISNLFSMFNHASQQGFKTQGIGLGLTTARKLSQAMAGAIHLKSIVSEGTEVGFSTFCYHK